MNIKRCFFLGDNWLYFKIYTGFKTADLLLKETIFPLVQYLKQNQLISHWFFIRYNDPDFHLRVRFYLSDSQNNGEIIKHIHNSLKNYFQIGLIWKIQYDTYNREIERYGENTMDISEYIFCIDSEMIVKLLCDLYGDESEKQRWLLALRAVDELLNSFELLLEEKLKLLDLLKNSFYKEFHIDGGWRKQFSLNFRENRKEIERIMYLKIEGESLLLPIFQKTENIKILAHEILILKNEGYLQVQFTDLICSYIHMMLNRFFRTQQRQHELVIYDYLFRFYDSEINKIKYSPKVLNF